MTREIKCIKSSFEESMLTQIIIIAPLLDSFFSVVLTFEMMMPPRLTRDEEEI